MLSNFLRGYKVIKKADIMDISMIRLRKLGLITIIPNNFNEKETALKYFVLRYVP